MIFNKPSHFLLQYVVWQLDRSQAVTVKEPNRVGGVLHPINFGIENVRPWPPTCNQVIANSRFEEALITSNSVERTGLCGSLRPLIRRKRFSNWVLSYLGVVDEIFGIVLKRWQHVLGVIVDDCGLLGGQRSAALMGRGRSGSWLSVPCEYCDSLRLHSERLFSSTKLGRLRWASRDKSRWIYGPILRVGFIYSLLYKIDGLGKTSFKFWR